MKTTAYTVLLIAVAFLLSACGDGGENWGIDYGKDIPISKCLNNSQDASVANAVVVPPNTTLRKTSEDTKLRVWHFQNSTEAVCLLSGEAVIVKDKQ